MTQETAISPASACPVTGDTFTLRGGELRADALIRNNPFPFYKALREQDKVYYDPQIDAWLVSRYDDAMQVLRDDDNFSLEQGYQERWANGFVDELADIMDREGGGFIRDPVADPPAHTRIRRLIEKAFTAHRVKSLEPRIRQIVIDQIESLADQGHADGMMDIGAPLTARIICEQLGFDYNDVGTQKIADWTRGLLAQMGRMQTHDELIENARLICDMQNYIIPRIRERENEPREDMISDLVHARLEDNENPTLSFVEKVAWVRAILIAGNDTTAAAIANMLMVLALQPELAQQLYEASDDDRLLTRFVEEILRLEPPTHGLFRVTRRDVAVGGTVIPANSHVCILFASANYDEKVFACPQNFDINRENVGKHLAFGAGIHRCIGAALSRMELKVAAQEIIKRLDNIELAIAPEDITYVPNVAMQTLERLPLTFTRRQ